MMRLFLDSSSLAKRYIAEKGTDRVLQRCGEASEIVLSILCIPETLSALNRLRREKKLSARQYLDLKQDLAMDVAAATMIELNEDVLYETIRCLEDTPVRAMDAIHIASALASICDIFLSADPRQCKAARRMGLQVEEIGN
jgi:predicted nucleic acid-binding protein